MLFNCIERSCQPQAVTLELSQKTEQVFTVRYSAIFHLRANGFSLDSPFAETSDDALMVLQLVRPYGVYVGELEGRG